MGRLRQRATTELDVSLASIAGSPLYYIILRGWADLAGSSWYALRFFSALCGTLAVPLIYQVARRLLGREAALVILAQGMILLLLEAQLSKPVLEAQVERRPDIANFARVDLSTQRGGKPSA
jgi:hypothetical protein